MRNRYKDLWLASASAAVLTSLTALPAIAGPVTFTTNTGAVTDGDSNTSIASTTITTSGPETQGAYLTGNSTATFYTWDFNGNVIPATGPTSGFVIDTSRGKVTNNFNNVTIQGNDASGISVITSGSSGSVLNVNTGSSILGGSNGATSSGIYVNSTSTLGGVGITVNSGAAVTNGSGAAGIHVARSVFGTSMFGLGESFVHNYGSVSGGTGTGDGIQLDSTALMQLINNHSGGTISGGDTGTSHGISIESNNSGSAGLITLTNNGTVNGGASGGDGVSLSSAGFLGTLSNAGNGIIRGGSGNTHGISLAGTAQITTINNTSSATIRGGTGTGDGIRVGSGTSVGTIDNQAVIRGGDTQGYGIHAAGGTITTISNTSNIYGTGSLGNGIRVSGGGTITTINNGASTSDLNLAKIAGSSTNDDGTGILIASGSTTIGTITNYGTISSRLNTTSTGGSGIHLTLGSLNLVDNYGLIRGGTTTGDGISDNSLATITTINNYDTGTISGADAIELTSSVSSTTINNSGTLSGNVKLTSTFGTGSTLNMYGGALAGDVYGSGGTYGTVNFNLVGGTFGTGGVSGGSSYVTSADLGVSGSELLAVNVNSGELRLADDIYATTTTVASGATLRPHSVGQSINGALVNNGTLQLTGNTFSINGNLSGSGTVTTTITAGTGGTHGYLFVSGAANFTNLTIVPTYNPGDVVSGETLVMVYSPSSLTYNALGMQSLHGISWRLTEATGSGSDYQGFAYTAGALLAIAGGVTDGVAATNAPGVSALSGYTGGDAQIQALQSGLTSNTNNDQAGAQLRPDANGGTVLAALGASEQAQDQIASRLNGSGMSYGEQLEGRGVWMHGFGTLARQGQIKGTNGFEMDSYGATFGADKLLASDAWRVGGAFTYANSDVDDTGVRTGSGETLDSYIGNVYGRYHGNRFYVDGAITAGVHQVDTRRLVNFVGNTLARGEYSSQQYGAKLEAGLPVAASRFTITPSAGFAYDTLLQDGYTETGAGGANLVVGDSTVHSYRGTLKAEATTSYALADGWQLRPALRIGYQHQFNDDLVPIQSVGMAGGGISFAAPGVSLPQNSALAGAEVELLSADRLSITARYDGEYREGYAAHSAHLRGRYEF